MTEELGPFRKVDPSIVVDDPFWGAVRRRHPDVEVVLLPGGVVRAVPAESLSAADSVAASVAAVRDAWGVVRPLLAAYGVTDPPSVRWSGAEGRQSLVLQKAAVAIGEDAGTSLLRRLAADLAGRGWALDPGLQRGVPALRAVRDAVSVVAAAGPGATVITVTGGPLSLGADVREAVRDEVRAEAASWR